MKQLFSILLTTSFTLTSMASFVLADDSAGIQIDATISAESTDEAQSIVSEIVEAPSPADLREYVYQHNLSDFVFLTPRAKDHFSLRHRVLLPLFESAEGNTELIEGQPAYLEFYDRTGLIYLPLRVSLDSEFDLGDANAMLLTPHNAPDHISFAIALACSEEGGIDWSIAPVMFDPKHMGGQVIPYDANALVTADSAEETEGDDEEDPGLLEAAADAIRDTLVGVWDGMSGGLASIGWGSEGAFDIITDKLNSENGGS
jgi:hypothetical protein